MDWKSYESLGAEYQNSGDFLRAKSALFQSYRLLEKSKNYYDQIDLALSLGDVHRQLEDFLSARTWYEKAQIIAARFQSFQNKSILIKAIDAAMGKALCLRGLGKFKDAEGWFKDLAEVYKREKDFEGRAYALWALGTTQRFLGDFKLAKKNLNISISLYVKLKDKSGLAYAWCGLGGTLRMMGFAKESAGYYKNAFTIFKKNSDDFGLAYSTCGQANAARMLKQNKKARELFSKAIHLYEAKNLKGPLGFVLWSLAQLEITSHNLTKAKVLLSRAEKLFTQVMDHRGLAYVYLGWGDYFGSENPKKSRYFYSKAYKLCKKMNLLFEMGHAQRHLSLINPSPYYRELGVTIPLFLNYPSLP